MASKSFSPFVREQIQLVNATIVPRGSDPMPTDANHPATVTPARRGRKYSHDPDTVPVLLSFWQELDFGGDTGTVRIRVRPLVNPTGGESPEVAAIAVEDADTPFTLEFIGQDGTVLHGVVERVDAGPFTGTGRQVRDRLDMTAQSVVRMVPRRYRIGAVPPRVPDPTVVTVPSMQVDVRCHRADSAARAVGPRPRAGREFVETLIKPARRAHH